MKNKVAFVELIQTAAIMIAFWYGYSRKNIPLMECLYLYTVYTHTKSTVKGLMYFQ